MRTTFRSLGLATRAVSTGMGVVAFLLAGPVVESAFAQAVQRAPAKADPAEAEAEAAKKKEAARRAYEAGTKAFEAGKLDPAIKSLSAALQAGGLASPEVAKAFYYRGVAYRKQGKLPQAISDLTSAIWLKNGLADRERSDAMENRTAAYREAGVSEGAPLPWASASGQAKPAAPTTPSAWQTATTDATAAPQVARETPPPAPAAPPAPTEPDSESGIGSFFSNLFGGSSSSKTAEPAPPPRAAAPPPPPEPAVSSWSQQTTVAEAPAKIAAVEPPKPPRAPAKQGKYRVQIATVRSREEADALAARVRSEHESNLGAATLAVEETLVGNMGTFYRVQAGPYRTAEEPGKICKSLKASGYDCLVMTQ